MTHLRINTNCKDMHRKYLLSLGIKELQTKSNGEISFHIHNRGNVLCKYHQWNMTNQYKQICGETGTHILLIGINLQSNLAKAIQIFLSFDSNSWLQGTSTKRAIHPKVKN